MIELAGVRKRFPYRDTLLDSVAATLRPALRAAEGNVTEARRLGYHRTQLRRWLAQHQVDRKRFRRFEKA